MRAGLMTEKSELVLPTGENESKKGSGVWRWAALGAVVLASAGHLLIKLGLTVTGGRLPLNLLLRIGHYLAQPWVLVGLAVYATGTALWIYAVSQRNISFLYPLTALTYAIVALGGKFMFGEHLSSGRWLGIGVVVLGVAMLHLSDREARE
jgi:drug/metabolite transporter (DMT)-like permease